MTVRVVVGEDQALMREGLVLVLESGGFEVVGTAADGGDLLRKARAHRPEMVVTDIRMPPDQTGEGLRAAISIRREMPETAIALLSQHVHAALLDEAMSGGLGLRSFAYLLKQRVADAEAFLADLRRIQAGGIVLDPEVAATMADHPSAGSVASLTSRQTEVLELMAEGMSNASIAERLVITEKAVGKHTTRIYEKLGLEQEPATHQRVSAVVRYLEHIA